MLSSLIDVVESVPRDKIWACWEISIGVIELTLEVEAPSASGWTMTFKSTAADLEDSWEFSFEKVLNWAVASPEKSFFSESASNPLTRKLLLKAC